MQLAVTLVTGLRDEPKRRVIAILGVTEEGEAIESGSDDDFALVLADGLVAAAEDGARGQTVVAIPAEADPVELALVLPHVFNVRGDVRLTSIISVVTAADLRSLLFRECPPGISMPTGLSERLALQLEFATTIVVAECGTCASNQRAEIRALLSRLNPLARQFELMDNGVLRATNRVYQPEMVEELGRGVGWMLELSEAPFPMADKGIECLLYRDPRLFHPGRLFAAVAHWLEPENAGLLIRSRGLIRLATRAGRVGSWSTAGDTLAIDPTSMTSWNADSPCGQELVFFGKGLNREYITRVLDSCLLTDDEFAAGPMEWETYYDPFPVWNVEHDH